MSSKTYKLRCSLPGHSKDVRCVTVGDLAGEESIVSGSRDKTAKLWAPEGLGFVCNQTFSGSEGYVSAVAVSQPSDSYPCGAIITGCQDGKIRIYNPESPTPVSTLTGHTDTVCALAVRPGLIISGSWDKTAKIWRSDGSSGPVTTLSGHAAAIWAVEVLSSSASETFMTITGSADKTIKLWQGDSPLQLYKGHTDCVRALAVVDASRFLSAANDATVRLWAVSGECLATYYGHTNYIYGLSMMPGSSDFVSCGEDRSLRIWKLEQPDECMQTVFLPAQSVWTVTVMKNSDIVTGSSDGLVRVFSNAAERMASPEMLEAYEAELGGTSLNAQLELGGIKASDLPGEEALFEPGTKEGQTKMVRQGGAVACYSWSSSEGQWVKVGDVVGAAGQSDSTKTLHEGKEYDYVFSVDIEEGKPPLKLPYNLTEDPWHAAQKFIHDNDLSQYYLDTVANFIITNTKGAGGQQQKQPSSNGGTYTDPFTGGSRYVPGSGPGNHGPAAAMPAQPSAAAVDPFTGSGRYVPQGGGAQAQKPAQHSFFPVKDFLRFDQANLEAISNKLKEFNSKVEPGLQLSDQDLQAFVKTADINSPTAGQIPHMDSLLCWPSEMLLPVLDILRLASRSRSINTLLAQRGDLPEKLLALGRSSVPNCMMVYRIFSHLVMHATTSQTNLMDCREAVLASLTSVMTDSDSAFEKHSQWKNIQVAVATVLLNYAVLVHSSPSTASLETKSQLFMAIGTIVPRLQEEEALFRILAAAGTLLGDEESIATARSLELNGSFEHLQNVPGKVGECAKYLLTVF